MRPASTPSSASARSLARSQSSGSCSDQPGRGVESGYSSSAEATTSPSGVTAIALTPVVPTSRPTRTSLMVVSVAAERGVHELVGAHRVLAGLRLTERGVVDPPRDRVDEAPLQDASSDRLDRILGVGEEVEPEPLAVRPVARAPELERELERLHERRRADHVVVVEGPPAGVRVLVAEHALRCEERRVLAEALAVHEQVLPVHVDLDVVEALGAELVDDV